MSEKNDPVLAVEDLIRTLEKTADTISSRLREGGLLKSYEKTLKKNLYKTISVSVLSGFVAGILLSFFAERKGKNDGQEK